MKNASVKNKGLRRIFAAAMAAVTVMTAAVICASAAGSEDIKTNTAAASAAPAAESLEAFAQGTVFGIGDRIELRGDYVVTDDFAGNSTVKSVDGVFKADTEFIGYTMKGQFEFIGFFGDQDLCITALDPVSTRPCDVKGIRVAGGTGTQSDPYRFAVEF